MITRKVGLLVLGFVLSFGAHADSKRYLVKFKSPATFFAVSQKVSAFSNPLGRNFPGSGVQLFNNSHARVQNSLNNIQMLVVESDDALSIQALKANPDVLLVEEAIMHPAPKPIGTRSKVQSTQPSAVSAKMIPTPWGIDAVKAPGAWTVTRGTGARVMILDTGANITHPAIASRYDQVQNFIQNGAAVDDVTDTVGHGTHVSGTIAADGANGGLVGVAPEARLLMGKVCDTGGCDSIAIASGLDWAIQENVDVVNMSLGGQFMSQGEATALQQAEDAGVMVVAASGNGDANGVGQPIVSFPAADGTVLAVGALDSGLVKAPFSNWGPELAVMGPGVAVFSSVPLGTGREGEARMNLEGKGLTSVTSEMFDGSPALNPTVNQLVFVGLGQTTDFAGVNVQGKFALIERGTISFKDKIANAFAAGAVGAVVFNNAPGLIKGTITTDGTEGPIPAIMIEQTEGQAAKAALAAGQTVEAEIGILRTDYSLFDGTSMATPHVSGVAALVRAANKHLNPAQVRALLKQTATPLTPNDHNQMGSGLVNADAAVHAALTMAVLPIAN